jgi:hypothetical protein
MPVLQGMCRQDSEGTDEKDVNKSGDKWSHVDDLTFSIIPAVFGDYFCLRTAAAMVIALPPALNVSAPRRVEFSGSNAFAKLSLFLFLMLIALNPQRPSAAFLELAGWDPVSRWQLPGSEAGPFLVPWSVVRLDLPTGPRQFSATWER